MYILIFFSLIENVFKKWKFDISILQKINSDKLWKELTLQIENFRETVIAN